MMGVCRKAQTEIRGSKGTSETSQELISSSKPLDSRPSVEHYDCKNEVANPIENYNNNILQRVHNVEDKLEEGFGKTFVRYSGPFSQGHIVDEQGKY